MPRAAAARPARKATKKPAPTPTADPNRIVFDGAKVVLHLVDEASGSYLLHLEVLHPELGHIVLPKEASFAGGIYGGLYVALTPQMAERAEAFLKRRKR